MKKLTSATFALLLAFQVQAQENTTGHSQPSAPVGTPDPTAHRHLGFALRLDAGIGGIGISAPSPMPSSSNVSGSFGIIIGGAVTENLILAGDLWGTGVFGGYGMMQNGGTGYGVGGLGLNVTYYFMPVNVYVSASPSVTTLTSMTHSNSTTSATSSAGFGAKIAVGKEWWVGDHWGLGLAGQFFSSWNGSQGAVTGTWTMLGGGLAFSATYN